MRVSAHTTPLGTELRALLKKRGRVSVAIVGGRAKSLSDYEWPGSFDVQHYDERRIKTLEDRLRSDAIDLVVIMSKWSSTTEDKLVKKTAKCPIRWWPGGFDLLSDAIGDAILGSEPPEVERPAPPPPLTAKIEEFRMTRPPPPPSPVRSSAPEFPPPPVPAVLSPSPAIPSPPSREVNGEEEKPLQRAASNTTWTDEENDAAALALEQCGGDAQRCWDNFHTLVPDRSIVALSHRLPVIAATRNIRASEDFFTALKRLANRARAAETAKMTSNPGGRRGRSGEFVSIAEAAVLAHRSEDWVRKAIEVGRVRYRLIGRTYDVSSVDIRVHAASEKSGPAAKAPAPSPVPVTPAPAPIATPAPAIVVPSAPIIVASPGSQNPLQPDPLALIRYRVEGVRLGAETKESAFDAIVKILDSNR